MFKCKNYLHLHIKVVRHLVTQLTPKVRVDQVKCQLPGLKTIEKFELSALDVVTVACAGGHL